MAEKGGRLPTKEEFSQQVDKTFCVSASEGPEFDVSLLEFTDIADTDTVETFSLLFRAPSHIGRAQGIYHLENDEMGSMDIFLVPIRQDEQGLYFEAVFNRLKEKGASA